MKNILAVHDISCVGRCSLTVALPVLSAAGLAVSVLPTAVLSTHTGGFSGYTFRDLTDDILPIADHWQSLDLCFDAIYTGYLGSVRQLEIVAELARRFKASAGNTAQMLIDPVMADHGRLYAHFTPDFPHGMLALCREYADIITPNITEALLMCGENGEAYREGPYTEEYIGELLGRLASVLNNSRGYVPQIVLTGVYFNEKEYGAAAYKYETGTFHFSASKKYHGVYHGTGDLFASVLLAAMSHGNKLERAADIAVEFTAASIARTKESGTDTRYGVLFEEGLSGLREAVQTP